MNQQSKASLYCEHGPGCLSSEICKSEKSWEKEFDERWKKKDYYDFGPEEIKSFIATRMIWKM